MRWLRSGLEAAVLAALIVQMAAPVKSTAAEWGSQSEDFKEDGEPTEEAETDGEQIALIAGPQTVRARQQGANFRGRSIVAIGSRGAVSRSSASASREMQQRNGIGGPLRC